MKKFLALVMIAAMSFGVVTSSYAFQTKKDGTADKRYKANKAAPKGPVKKDGTADKRFKANKPAAPAPAKKKTK